MTDDEIREFKKLSWPDQICHKNWKCRKIAYDELPNRIKCWDSTDEDAGF